MYINLSRVVPLYVFVLLVPELLPLFESIGLVAGLWVGWLQVWA